VSQSSHAGDIAFSTAFLADKICAIKTGTFTASAWNVGGFLYRYAIPHSLTRPAFMDGTFSADDATFVPNGQADSTYSYITYSDSSNYYILTTADSGVLYYKLVATWIDNYDTTNPLVSPDISTALPSLTTPNFDSRQNYQKIFYQQMYTVSSPGSGVRGQLTIPHNLGYIPNYKIYFEAFPGQVWPSISGGTADIWLYDFAGQYECWGLMDEDNLMVYYQPGTASASSIKIWVRIYFDQ
jgi:hypothetical protein